MLHWVFGKKQISFKLQFGHFYLPHCVALLAQNTLETCLQEIFRLFRNINSIFKHFSSLMLLNIADKIKTIKDMVQYLKSINTISQYYLIAIIWYCIRSFLSLQTIVSTPLNCIYRRTTERYCKCFCSFLNLLNLSADYSTELGNVLTINNAHSYTATSGTHG